MTIEKGMESNGQIFFLTEMPASRPADFYLGYLDGSVFLDFNNVQGNRISLLRISFDGYGCWTLGDVATPLTEKDSELFSRIIQEELKDQVSTMAIVRKAIHLNKDHIWQDALAEYNLM
jgi:hypothetical protein